MNYPTEGALNWELELNALKERGVEQINLIISDALQGIERAVCSAFSQAAHQFCVVRFKRHVLNQVTKKDKDLLKQELDNYSRFKKRASHHSKLLKIYVHLLSVGVSIYRSSYSLSAPRNIAYITYLRFSESVRRMI